ncbi:hypothetical protein FWH30_01810 [Microgenomates group bacterium]|nr:hypothetical protein [Microgenomates group bacterium]
MSIRFDFDNEIIKKRIKATRLGSQVVLASAIFGIGIICWFFFEFIFMEHTLVEHDFASLVEKPFTFALNEEVFSTIAQKKQYTSSLSPATATLSAVTLELDSFPIFIIDQEASKRARDLVIVNKNTNLLLTPTAQEPLITVTTPDFVTITIDDSSSDVTELIEIPTEDGEVVTTTIN